MVETRSKLQTKACQGLNVSPPPSSASHSLVGSWVKLEAVKPLPVAVSVIPSVAGRTEGSPQEKRASMGGLGGGRKKGQ